MRKVDYIVIHTSETPVINESEQIDDRFGAEQIRKWHTDPKPKGRGWKDIGYHYVIRRTGVIEYGRPVSEVGSHVKGYNENSIGICWIGGAVNVDGKRHLQDNRTWQQRVYMRLVVQTLLNVFPNAKVVGHRDLNNARECPLFDVKTEL